MASVFSVLDRKPGQIISEPTKGRNLKISRVESSNFSWAIEPVQKPDHQALRDGRASDTELLL